jgi:uncharacterized RDD family membrane protein YckC
MTENSSENKLNFEKHIGRKYVATLIDYFIIYVFCYIAALFLGEVSGTNFKLSNGAALLPIAFWFIYLPIIEGTFQSTLGHYLVGLRVIQMTGEDADQLDCIKRRILDPIDFILFGVPAIIAIKHSKYSQRLGDQYAKTIVVDSKMPRERLRLD